jgi:CBS domain-containing protein
VRRRRAISRTVQKDAIAIIGSCLSARLEKSLREVKPTRGLSSANIRNEIRSEQNPIRVKEAMTLGLIGVPETATLSEALDALLRGRISALFVFDASGEPGYLVPPADAPGI